MNISEATTANLKIPLAIGVALMIALLMGSLIGSEDLKTLALIWGAGGAIVWVVYLYQFTWPIALLLCYVGLNYSPTGFQMGAIHVTAGMGMTLAAIFGWQKRAFTASPALEKAGLRAFTYAQVALLLYLAGHFLYNWAFPYSIPDFQLKNAVKSYFSIVAPPLLLLYFTHRPMGIEPRASFVRVLTNLILLGLLVNLAMALYLVFMGRDVQMSDFGEATDTVLIPGINATINPYMLRGLGPAAMLAGTLFITGPKAPRKEGPGKILCLMLCLLGVVGSLLSGGRATVFIGLVFCALTFCVRGKVAILSLLAVICFAGFIAVNVMSDFINSQAPVFMQRSVQWALIDKNETVDSDIVSSSAWRYSLFERAIAEWKSDSRILWFGRSTYGYGAGDEMARQVESSEADLVTSLRRGATHNLLTDLLVAYGLVGAVLYFISYFTTIRLLVGLYRHAPLDWGSKNMLLFLLIPAAPGFVLNLIAGGLGDITGAWLMVVVFARIRMVEKAAVAEEAEQKRRPARIPGLREALPAGRPRDWLVPQA